MTDYGGTFPKRNDRILFLPADEVKKFYTEAALFSVG